MFDPSRFRGVAAAIAAVGLAMAGCSLLAQAAFRERPSWLSAGDSTMEGGQDAVVGRRISGVLAELRRRGKSPSDLDLGVVLGASAVGMAIEPKLLESSGDPRIPARWLSLYASGANVEDLRGLADLLLGSGLRPRLFLLGIHPSLLARSDHYLSDETAFDPSPFLRAVAGGRLRDAKDEFMVLMAAPLNAAFPNRTRIGHGSRVFVIETKRRMFARLGMGAESLYSPDRDPWAVRLLYADPEEAPGKVEEVSTSGSVRELNEGLRVRGLRGDAWNKGWFDRANYSAEGQNARALVAIIRQARGRGIEPVIVLLPESTTMRGAVPAEAMECLRAVLQGAFGSASPPVVDLRDSIPDDRFHDNVHPRREGRMDATRSLIKALGGLPTPVRPTPVE
jgi:hypothetical protein